MYHKDIVLGLDAALGEVAEYCVRKIAGLISTFKPEWPIRDIKTEAKMSAIQVCSHKSFYFLFTIYLDTQTTKERSRLPYCYVSHQYH